MLLRNCSINSFSPKTRNEIHSLNKMCRYLLLFLSVYNFSLSLHLIQTLLFSLSVIFKWVISSDEKSMERAGEISERQSLKRVRGRNRIIRSVRCKKREKTKRRKYRWIEWILDTLWMAGNERKSQQKETQQQSNFFFHSFPSIRTLWFLLKMSHTLYPDRHTEQAQNRLHQTYTLVSSMKRKRRVKKVTNFLALFIKVSFSLFNRCTHSRSLFLQFLFLLNHFFFVISCCCFCCYAFCLLLLLSFFSSRRCHHHHHLRFSYLKHWGSCVHSSSKHTLLQMLLTSGDDDFVWGNPVINLSFLSSVIMLFFCPLI